jgi:hypothetical protein
MRNSRNGGNNPKIPLTGDIRRHPIQFSIPIEDTTSSDAQDILANRQNREIDQSYSIVDDKNLTTERSLQFNPIDRTNTLDLKAKHFEPTDRIFKDPLNIDITVNAEQDAFFGKYKAGNRRKTKLRHVEVPLEFEEIPIQERIDARSIRQNDDAKGKIGTNSVDTGNVTDKQHIIDAMPVRDSLHAVPNIKQDGQDNAIRQINLRNQENVRRLAAQTFKREYGRDMTYEDVEFLARSEPKSEVREGRFYDSAPNIISRIQTDGFGTVFNSLPSVAHYREFFRREVTNAMHVDMNKSEADIRMYPDPIHEKDFLREKKYIERNHQDVQVSGRKTPKDARKNVGHEKHDVDKNRLDLELKERKIAKDARKNVGHEKHDVDRNRLDLELKERKIAKEARKNVGHEKHDVDRNRLDLEVRERKIAKDARKYVGHEKHDVDRNRLDLEVRERKIAKEARKNAILGKHNIDRNHAEVVDGLKIKQDTSAKKISKEKSRLDRDTIDVDPNVRGEGKQRSAHEAKESAPKDEVEVETSVRNIHGGRKYKKHVQAKANQQRDHNDGITFITIDKMKDFTRVQTPGKQNIGIDHQEVTSKFKSSGKERKNVQLGKTMGNDDIEFLPVGKIKEQLETNKSKVRGNKSVNRGIEKEGHDIAVKDQKPPKTREKITAKQGAPGAEDEEDISAPVVKQKKSKRNENKAVKIADDTKDQPVEMIHPKQIYF